MDSAETTAESVAQELTERGLRKPGGTSGGFARFFATDDPERFAKVGEIFLGQPLCPADITLVDL